MEVLAKPSLKRYLSVAGQQHPTSLRGWALTDPWCEQTAQFDVGSGIWLRNCDCWKEESLTFHCATSQQSSNTPWGGGGDLSSLILCVMRFSQSTTRFPEGLLEGALPAGMQ